MAINLSAGIPEWFVSEFQATLYHVCQQKVSKFGMAVDVRSVLNAEDKAFDMMDAFTLEEKTARNQPTPSLDASTQRRWVDTTPYHNSVLFDKDDDLDMIIEPSSDFVTAFRRAVNRKKDDIVIAAFDATVSSGRRKGSTITWASQSGNVKYTSTSGGRTIPHDCSEGNCNAADTGMTVEKAQLALEYFNFNDCDEDIPVWCAISPRQATDLFGQEEYVNIDFNTSKPSAVGRILRNWHGINWIVSTKIAIGTNNDVDGNTNVYRCPVWQQDGIKLGVADEVTIRISELPTQSYSQQVYAHMNMGAMRIDEDKVCYIEAQA